MKTSDKLQPGEALGNYEIIRELATGGMATIYLARIRGTAGFEKNVVLKCILPYLASEHGFVTMFLDEARLAATLRHPNIADVFDVGVEDGTYFFAMEYVHGQNAREVRLKAKQQAMPVPLGVGLAIASGTASALSYAHTRTGPQGALNLVHRDVSPSNILVSVDGAVKLVDFGIARASSRRNKTRTGMRKGKAPYLAYKMEVVSGKEQILETYLNQIYFGQGAYGVGSAAHSYFGKDIRSLNLAESAFLAGLPKSPSRFSPFSAYELAKNRQEHVLARMEEVGFITAAEREAAAREKLNFQRPGSEHLAPYFVEYVRQQLVAKYGESMVYKGGLQIYTTLNLEMQKAAEAVFLNGVRELDKREGWRGPRRTVDLATFQPSALTQGDQMLKPGYLGERVALKVAKDHYVVQVGAFAAKLAFDDMAWAKRILKGSDPTVDFVVNPNIKSLLKPGDVIEIGVKKLTKDGVQLTLEQTPIVDGGLIAIDPKTGAIRAMVGGYNFSRSEYNRAVQAHRQPGSAFKPLIYATAMSQGLSPATRSSMPRSSMSRKRTTRFGNRRTMAGSFTAW